MAHHEPVLLERVLALADGATTIVDGTLGDGGHSGSFLAAGATVLGVDRDPEALARAKRRFAGNDRLRTVGGNVFDREVQDRIRAFAPDFVLLDLGVSSRQLDDDALGFSFRPAVPLDMRLGRSGPTAAGVLAQADPSELARWFRDFGDEPRARRLAGAIVRRRANRPLESSDDLVNAIREALGAGSGPADFARLFQALRIVVNDELAGLERGLPGLRDALVDGGTLAVISYHSGEDRIVKHGIREWSRSCVCPPEFPVCACRGRPLGRVLTRRPVLPSSGEMAANPRSRSARLRAFRVEHDGG